MAMFRLSFLLSFTLAAGATAAPRLDDSNFKSLHALLQPRADELKWQQIPWQTNLWDARREAARTGKPIYLWEMDGHPLGCT